MDGFRSFKAVDHGDFYKAIRHSLSLANEPLGQDGPCDWW